MKTKEKKWQQTRGKFFFSFFLMFFVRVDWKVVSVVVAVAGFFFFCLTDCQLNNVHFFGWLRLARKFTEKNYFIFSHSNALNQDVDMQKFLFFQFFLNVTWDSLLWSWCITFEELSLFDCLWPLLDLFILNNSCRLINE